MSRRKRSFDLEDTGWPGALLILKSRSMTFYIELEINEELFDSANSISMSDNVFDEDQCHFHGVILNEPGGVAAISGCSDSSVLSGILLTPVGTFILKPASETKEFRKNSGSIPHLLIEYKDENDQFCGVDHSKRLDFVHSLVKKSQSVELADEIRKKRELNSGAKRKVIEVAVFVDSVLYERIAATSSTNARRETVRRVLGIMNQVQLIYNYATLETKFKLVVVKLEILKPNATVPNAASGDIDQYLDNFCVWQSSLNVREGSLGHWDHAIMLTGRDLFKEDRGKRNSKVLGLAWVNGMCRSNYSCTLNEGTSFEASFVIAHEMGHNLGIMHDGSGNNCDRNKYIMSDKTGPGKVNWSTCSNVYIKNFFISGYGWCLEDDSLPPNRSYDLQRQGLPGTRYTLEDQCSLALGPGYIPHQDNKEPFNNVCRELWCASGSWAKPAHPALEGSSCATGKVCSEGSCRRENPRRSKSTSQSVASNLTSASSSSKTNRQTSRRLPDSDHHGGIGEGSIFEWLERSVLRMLANVG